MDTIRAVCFDAFGTIVEITDKRRPFRVLQSEQLGASGARDALIKPLSLREIAKSVGEARLAELEADLAAECGSIRLRRGMDLVWASLRSLGIKIGVCSNLAAPYEQPLLACLPGIPDALVLSFRAGVTKPQPAIYRMVCAKLQLTPSQILFVGDTLEADVLGPRTAGLFAISIEEFESAFGKGHAASVPPPVAELFDRLRSRRAAWAEG
jgi:HAD superfamily hydrolase (TIGR01549 family)